MDTQHVRRHWLAPGSNRISRAGQASSPLTSSAASPPFPSPPPFPPTKDVDIHLIFADGSPALQPSGPFMTMIETAYEGILIEAGIKSVADYASAAHRPGKPRDRPPPHPRPDPLRPERPSARSPLAVRRGFAEPQWVQARIEHERRGAAGALAMRPMASAMYGASGEVNVLGYRDDVSSARSSPSRPSTRPRWAGVPGLTSATDLGTSAGSTSTRISSPSWASPHAQRDRVECLLDQGAALFDLAVAVKRTPHPFGHKLHAHLRPYFVDSCKGMIAEGNRREALGWLAPFTLASTDVMLADGPDNEFARTVALQESFLRELGMDTPEERGNRYARAETLFAQIFALAEQIAASRANSGAGVLVSSRD